MTPKISDTIERLFWTFVAAFVGQLVGAEAGNVEITYAAGKGVVTGRLRMMTV